MLAYDDVDHDTHLNLNEFYAAFSKLYSKIPTGMSFFFPIDQIFKKKKDKLKNKFERDKADKKIYDIRD